MLLMATEKNIRTGIFINGGETGEGVVYKDMDAWESGEGVCYIGECEFEKGWCSVNYKGNTRDEIIADMAEYLPNCDVKFIEQCAENVLQTCDWQCLTTMMVEIDWEECIKEVYKEGTEVFCIPWYSGVECGWYDTVNNYKDENEIELKSGSEQISYEVYRKSDKVCKHCGGSLCHEHYNNTRDHYPYFCPECDENFFEFEAR